MTDGSIPIRVAFDVGPLVGPRTGIGLAVAAMHDGLQRDPSLQLKGYRTSFRAGREQSVSRLPVPAMAAHRWWARFTWPTVDRWLDHPDVVHGTNYVVPPTRVPAVVSVYDCWFLRHPSRANGDVRRAGQVLRRSIERGATVHASSQATGSALREFFPGARIEVITLGALAVPESTLESPLPTLRGRPFIVAIGTLERRKNLPALVRAFGHVAEQHADVQLVLAGADGDDRAEIDAAILELGVQHSSRVVITGRIDDGTRGWLLRHAAALAYPSLDEGFGFPLLDAMQVGLPVVASNAGSIPEVAGDAALLTAPDDITGLAEHLLVALGDDQRRQQLVAAGRQRAAMFTWDACCGNLAALYRQLATDGSERTNE